MTRKSVKEKLKIGININDDEFKANYNPNVLLKQSTLVLKTSFHTINLILMGICSIYCIA